MPKLERLVELSRLRRNREVVTVREMSEACGVSQRTIYRYLNTLSELNIPAELRKSPRRSPVNRSGLNQDDLTLARYALENNPLVQYRYFARRLARIDRVLPAASPGTGRPAVIALVDTGKTGRRKTNSDGDQIVERFARAREEGKAVKLRVRGRGSVERVLLPEMIRLNGARIALGLIDPENGRNFQVDLGEVRSLAVCHGRASTTRTKAGLRRRSRKKS